MKLITLSAFLLLNLAATSAFATIDSFINVKVPVAKMQEEGYFFATVPAWDGISGGMSHVPLNLMTLAAPFRVQGIQAGEDKNGWVKNVNALHKSGVTITDVTNLDQEMYFDITRIEIDGTETSKKDDSSTADQKIKLAIYTVVSNLSSSTKKLIITLKGIPAYQPGAKNKLPSKFNYPLTLKSPFVVSLKKELNI